MHTYSVQIAQPLFSLSDKGNAGLPSKTNDLPKSSRRNVLLGNIRTETKRFQPRDFDLDEEHVADLVRALRRGSQLPPLKVWADNQGALGETGALYVIGGHHRLAAYQRLGRGGERRTVELYNCDLAEAELVAVADNSPDFLPMTTAQRSQFAWRLHCDHGRRFSKDQLARCAGISPRTVATMRRIYEELGRAGEDVPALWSDARDMSSSRTWELTDEQREAIFRERRKSLVEKVRGPIKHEAQRDVGMVLDVVKEAMGEEDFEAALARDGFVKTEQDNDLPF